MNINLPQEELDYLERQVAAGRYPSIEDAVVGVVRVERVADEQLRAEIQIGLDQHERGESIELSTSEARRAFFEAIKQRGRERLERDKILNR